MKKRKIKVIPYGKWWEYLLRLKFRMAYYAIFGMFRRDGPLGSPLILDNWGLTIHIPDNPDATISTQD